jgi:hypothetical protein
MACYGGAPASFFFDADPRRSSIPRSSPIGDNGDCVRSAAMGLRRVGGGVKDEEAVEGARARPLWSRESARERGHGVRFLRRARRRWLNRATIARSWAMTAWPHVEVAQGKTSERAVKQRCGWQWVPRDRGSGECEGQTGGAHMSAPGACRFGLRGSKEKLGQMGGCRPISK